MSERKPPRCRFRKGFREDGSSFEGKQHLKKSFSISLDYFPFR